MVILDLFYFYIARCIIYAPIYTKCNRLVRDRRCVYNVLVVYATRPFVGAFPFTFTRRRGRRNEWAHAASLFPTENRGRSSAAYPVWATVNGDVRGAPQRSGDVRPPPVIATRRPWSHKT